MTTYDPQKIFIDQTRRTLEYLSKFIDSHRYSYADLQKESNNVIKAVQAGLRFKATFPSTVDLLLKGTDPLLQIGERKRWAVVTESVLRKAQVKIDESPLVARISLSKAKVLGESGRHQDALNILEETVKIADSYQDGDLGWEAHYYAGINHLYLNRLTDAWASAQATLTLLNRYPISEIERGLAHIYNLLGEIAIKREEYVAATSYLTPAIQQAGKIGDIYQLGWALNNFGSCREMTGDLNSAVSYFREALTHYAHLPSHLLKVKIQTNAGRCLRKLGHLSESETILREIAYQGLREIGAHEELAEAITELAYTVKGLNEMGEAKMLFESALDEWGTVGDAEMASKMEREIEAL
ncbi:MAG: tetratricopeptide repeat protein [Chloroflexota bacterium]